jgi:hypothetical protein
MDFSFDYLETFTIKDVGEPVETHQDTQSEEFKCRKQNAKVKMKRYSSWPEAIS